MVGGSAKDLQLTRIADHNELSATFKQVKAPASNFGHKCWATDLTLDIAYGAADNACLANRLGGEEVVQPGLSQKRRGAEHLHPDRIGNRDEEIANGTLQGRGRGLSPAAMLARI